VADDSASFQSRRELNLGKLLVQSNSRSRTEISNDRPCIMLAEMGEHPRLLAAQQPSRHEQVLAGDLEEQEPRTR